MPFHSSSLNCEEIEPLQGDIVDPPHRLAFHWGEDWHVSFQLEAEGTKTRLTLVHDGWVADKVAPETGWTYQVIRDRMDEGWKTTVLPRLREVCKR